MRRDHGQGRPPDAARGRGRSRIHVDVEAAAGVIAGRLHRTPLFSSDTLGARFGGRAFLKAELFQKTGSFKPRGVLTKLASLTADEKASGVISISAGNHAQALAWASAREGIECLLVTWRDASPLKVAATRGYGATVDQEAADHLEAFARVRELQRRSGRTLVHPFDDPFVVAGQGTVGLEIAEELPDVDVVVVPVGGGGLVSGIATALAGKRVVALEPEGSAALHIALEAGEPVEFAPDSLADALNAPVAGNLPLQICAKLGVESILITDDDIRAGFRFLYERAKLAAEPGAAAGVGALLADKVPDVEGKIVTVVVSGGNVSAETAAAILNEE
ncbi:MAG TPA: pyridoxal-phosphate dependent enzyme [Gaiellaceae bacterium]|nr:pyridoxal-phosphate dependent enzyme [Gaiellaceae bacterium]